MSVMIAEKDQQLHRAIAQWRSIAYLAVNAILTERPGPGWPYAYRFKPIHERLREGSVISGRIVDFQHLLKFYELVLLCETTGVHPGRATVQACLKVAEESLRLIEAEIKRDATSRALIETLRPLINLTPVRRQILEVLDQAKARLTQPRIFLALKDIGLDPSKHTVRIEMPRLVKAKWVDKDPAGKSPGYGITGPGRSMLRGL